ncbi:hypothetical protein GCM10028818_39550 [Spirosoma horti]
MINVGDNAKITNMFHVGISDRRYDGESILNKRQKYAKKSAFKLGIGGASTTSLWLLVYKEEQTGFFVGQN